MRISDWSSDVCSSDLSGFLQTLERELVLGEIDALGLLEILREEFQQLGVEILAAQEGVAVGRLHLEHAVADLADRDIERAAATVVDRDRLVLVLVEPVGARGRGRLVDDAQHFQPGDLRSEEHTSELQSLMRISYAVFCLKHKQPN